MKALTWFQKNIFYFVIFFFFLIINYLSPPIFDDWEVSTWLSSYNQDYFKLLTHGIYYSWLLMNGRALTNVIMVAFTYFDFIWKITSALIFVFISYTVNKTTANRNSKFTLPLTLLLLLSVSSGIRMETYSYISSYIAYIFAFALALLFYQLIKNRLEEKNSWLTIILFFIFSLIIGSWMENLSIGFTAALFFANLLYWIKNKRINYLLVLTFIASFLGFLFLVTSPGLKVTREVYNGTMGLWGTFKLSFVKNINLIFYQNKLIFLILTLASFLYIKTNDIKTKNKTVLKLYLGFLLCVFSVLFFSLIIPYIPFIPKTFVSRTNQYLFSNQIYITTFWFISMLMPIVSIYFLKQNRSFAFLAYIYAIFCIFPLFFIGQTGSRIIAVPILSYIIITILLASQIFIKKNEIFKVTYYLLIFTTFIHLINWLYLYTSIYSTQKIRNIIINEAVAFQHLQKWDYEKDVVVLPKFQDNQVLYYGVTDKKEFHYPSFLKYYHLNPNTQVIFE